MLCSFPFVPRPTGCKYKTILALDGGGLRLYFTNQILKEIEEQIQTYILDHSKAFPDDLQFSSKDEFGVYLADYFNCISGTSASSWTTVYLASKGDKAHEFLKSRAIVDKYGEVVAGTARGMDVFFLEYSDKIYPSGFLNYLRGISFRRSALFPFKFPGVNAPRHLVDGLVKALKNFVGDLKYSDLHTSCLVGAYDLKSNGPLVFVADRISSHPHVAITLLRSKSDPRRHLRGESTNVTTEEPWKTGDLLRGDLIIKFGVEFTLADAALASSALPMYHPAHKAKPVNGSDEEYLFIDGALVESNPTLFSFNYVTSQPGIALDDIATISLGTGGVAGDYITNMNGGAIAWTVSGDMIDIAVGGAAEAKQAEVDYLLYSTFHMEAGQYLRINHFAEDPESEEATAFSAFNSPDYLQIYEEVGKQTAKLYSDVIASFVEKFMFGTETGEAMESTKNMDV